jgi:pimeloyl-ACP methyl ester carboxylesterase
MTVTMLAHNRVRLALHRLRTGSGRPLLLLHGLGECSPQDLSAVPAAVASWPGPIAALDFTGHGRSSVPAGGGYSAEILLADADAALAELGPLTVLGRGLGAYVALMLAGARARDVHGAVLVDGSGLAGGATVPTSQAYVNLPPADATPDPCALFELSRDLRPPDYAAQFVRLAVDGSSLPEPIAVGAVVRPPWLAAVVGEVGVFEATVAEALLAFQG